MKKSRFSSKNSSTTVLQAGARSTGPVDRRQKQQIGRPVRSTDVHADMHRVAVDRRRRAVDRPVGRLKVPNSRLGTVTGPVGPVDRPGRPVRRVGRPAGRPTVGFGLFRKGLILNPI